MAALLLIAGENGFRNVLIEEIRAANDSPLNCPIHSGPPARPFTGTGDEPLSDVCDGGSVWEGGAMLGSIGISEIIVMIVVLAVIIGIGTWLVRSFSK